ncbi:hypothetical protein NPIL_494931 [Nephila pilipes]|uniref:Uncharacterized protein n=1 Tax=Nephila pilipes TaxID=299642 RepID=A0A8X6QXR4_NEPPI|nr:hypothetical protein NPIL_494931 [Nephila pilipes]
MEMLNDSQNEMEFLDDSRSTISPISSISSISTSSIDTSSTCERKQKIESNIQVYTNVRHVTKRELAQNFSIHNDYEHPEYKSLKNSISGDTLLARIRIKKLLWSMIEFSFFTVRVWNEEENHLDEINSCFHDEKYHRTRNTERSWWLLSTINGRKQLPSEVG